MAFVEPTTLSARGVDLVPLTLEHEAGLKAASRLTPKQEAAVAAERERIKAELLAEMQGQGGQQQQAQQQPQNMPTSFAQARNNGPRAAVAFSGPKPLSEIMGGR